MGMGIGAMVAAMLRLPMTAVLLATLLLASDGIAVMPLVIVAVVTAYVAIAWLDPPDRRLWRLSRPGPAERLTAGAVQLADRHAPPGDLKQRAA